MKDSNYPKIIFLKKYDTKNRMDLKIINTPKSDRAIIEA